MTLNVYIRELVSCFVNRSIMWDGQYLIIVLINFPMVLSRLLKVANHMALNVCPHVTNEYKTFSLNIIIDYEYFSLSNINIS